MRRWYNYRLTGDARHCVWYCSWHAWIVEKGSVWLYPRKNLIKKYELELLESNFEINGYGNNSRLTQNKTGRYIGSFVHSAVDSVAVVLSCCYWGCTPSHWILILEIFGEGDLRHQGTLALLPARGRRRVASPFGTGSNVGASGGPNRHLEAHQTAADDGKLVLEEESEPLDHPCKHHVVDQPAAPHLVPELLIRKTDWLVNII